MSITWILKSSCCYTILSNMQSFVIQNDLGICVLVCVCMSTHLYICWTTYIRWNLHSPPANISFLNNSQTYTCFHSLSHSLSLVLLTTQPIHTTYMRFGTKNRKHNDYNLYYMVLCNAFVFACYESNSTHTVSFQATIKGMDACILCSITRNENMFASKTVANAFDAFAKTLFLSLLFHCSRWILRIPHGSFLSFSSLQVTERERERECNWIDLTQAYQHMEIYLKMMSFIRKITLFIVVALNLNCIVSFDSNHVPAFSSIHITQICIYEECYPQLQIPLHWSSLPFSVVLNDMCYCNVEIRFC